MRIEGTLRRASFLERPNRFLSVVELDGQRVEAHLPDPGRLEELLAPGRTVWVRPATGPGRKTGYTLTLVEAPSGELVSLVTTWPNRLVAESLESNWLPELAGWELADREYRWGNSRFDFRLRDATGAEMLLEVKSVTLVEDDRALFPDARTARGTRHVRELAAARVDGLKAAVLFVVQRADAASVTAARAIDPAFADALDEAVAAGVRTLAYRCRVTLDEARLTEPIPVHVGEPPDPGSS